MSFLRFAGWCGLLLAGAIASCSNAVLPPDTDAGVVAPPDGGKCPGLTECGGQCVSTKRDPENCGACGKKCSLGEVCVQGGCALQCGGGSTKCNALCVSTQSDPTNCGMCGNKCLSGQVCSAGKCAATCQQGLTDCSGACVDLQTDEDHCGMCGTACAAGKRCAGGACVASCQSGWSACPDGDGGTTCVNLKNDPQNCGMCGNACQNGFFCVAPGDGGAPACDLQCFGGTTKCSNKCVDTMIDPANCGGCGVPCNGWCSSGQCCPQGQLYCAGQCKPASQCAIAYTRQFTQSQIPPVQHCTDWNNYRAQVPSNATSIVIKGSNDTTGVSCTGGIATQIVQAFKAGSAFSAMCNGRQWSTGVCAQGIELSGNGTCTCASQYVLRPCINHQDWGGVASTSCNAPTQVMTVEIQ